MVDRSLFAPVEPSEHERAAAATVLRMIQGIHISRAVFVVAELGVADLLASGPMSSEELARATQTHEPSLYRVLRVLASLGVFTEEKPRSFGLTLLGERLRRDVPASVRSWAMLVEAQGGVRAFEHIADTVRTGEPGFDIAHGLRIFEFLAQHPEHAAKHDAAETSYKRTVQDQQASAPARKAGASVTLERA